MFARAGGARGGGHGVRIFWEGTGGVGIEEANPSGTLTGDLPLVTGPARLPR